MEKKFVPYDIAVKLNQLGYSEPCIAFFDLYKHELHPVMQEPAKGYFNVGNFTETLRAPLWQDVIDWFEEKFGLTIIIEPYTAKFKTFKIYRITEIVEILCLYGRDVYMEGDRSKRYDNSYDAKVDAILKAIEICQKENR